MVNRVSSQFVNGQDHVFGPVFRQPGLTGMGPAPTEPHYQRGPRVNHPAAHPDFKGCQRLGLP